MRLLYEETDKRQRYRVEFNEAYGEWWLVADCTVPIAAYDTASKAEAHLALLLTDDEEDSDD